MSIRRTNAAAFLRNSPLCRADGLTTSVRLPARSCARATALAAVIVDFPHCRVQFNINRRASRRNGSACRASGSNPSQPSRFAPPVSAGRRLIPRPPLLKT